MNSALLLGYEKGVEKSDTPGKKKALRFVSADSKGHKSKVVTWVVRFIHNT